MHLPVTRKIIAQLEAWLLTLSRGLPAPEVREDAGQPAFRFTANGPMEVSIAKAVRLVSGLNACLILSDQGYITEAATLLRTLHDFACEIIFLMEGQMRQEGPTKDQRQFVTDFFAPVPVTLEELETASRANWLSRAAIYKAHGRLAEAGEGVDADALLAHTRLLDVFHNGYAHGGYREAMDLYNGGERRFEVRGHPSAEHRRALRIVIAQKTYFCLVAFWLVAHVHGQRVVADEIMAAQGALMRATEYLTGDAV